MSGVTLCEGFFPVVRIGKRDEYKRFLTAFPVGGMGVNEYPNEYQGPLDQCFPWSEQ